MSMMLVLDSAPAAAAVRMTPTCAVAGGCPAQLPKMWSYQSSLPYSSAKAMLLAVSSALPPPTPR